MLFTYIEPVYFLSFTIGLLSAIFTMVYIVRKIFKPRIPASTKTSDTETTVIHEECAYPNCIRCRRRSEIIDRAKKLFKLYAKYNQNSFTSSTRHELIQKQLKKVKFRYGYELQKPNIFYLPQIEAKPFWDLSTESLTKNKPRFAGKILQEYDQIRNNKDGWKVNETSIGSWKIFHLIDQGVVTENAKLCPKTLKFLLAKKNSMHETVFGNAAFSVLSAGTHIPPHCGPTNIRLRCHIGLQIPRYSYLTVGFEKQLLHKNKCVTFDDSFLHSAENNGDLDRVVLLYDIWHPEIQSDLDSKQLLSEIFSSL